MTPPYVPLGYRGLCSRGPLRPPPAFQHPVLALYGQQARQNRREHLFSLHLKTILKMKAGRQSHQTLSRSLLTFHIANSLSSLPGRKAICISRGQDVAISFYHLKLVIKSLFGNKTMHARKDGLCRLKLTAPVIPDFPGCCWRNLNQGGTGTAGDANDAKPQAPHVRLELLQPWETRRAKGDRGLPWESGGFAPRCRAQAWL